MTTRAYFCLLVGAGIVAASMAAAQDKPAGVQEEFNIKDCKLLTTGRNTYFIMEPGFQLVLESDEQKMEITVLDDTKVVDGVTTRVVEEREWKDGKLHEVTRNYFAMCEATKDVFYFGEDVDYYENGKVVRHDGSWLAGKDGGKAGLIMAGAPKVGMKYFQEQAPGKAMDYAEIVSVNETCKTPAGTFASCLKVKEGNALEPDAEEYKFYAPNIGLLADEDLRLIRYGFIKK